MKSTRFQPLGAIYKNQCSLLYDAAFLLYTTDFTQPEAAEALEKTGATLLLFQNQAAKEEAFLFPLIHDYEPLVAAILHDDYRERMQHIQPLQQMINEYETGSERYKSILFSGRLLRRFNELITISVEQMKVHESLVNPVFWRYHSDEELHHVADSIGQALAKENTGPPVMRKEKQSLAIQ